MMDEVLQFFQNFGNLINTALLVSLTGILYSIFRATIAQKNAELDLTRERLEAARDFSIENVSEKFQTLKIFYERDMRDWYEASIASLEEEKQKAIEENEKEFQKKIEGEIAKRKELINEIANRSDEFPAIEQQVTLSDVSGDYSITGHNPYKREYSYLGTLKIRQKGQVLIADWWIGRKQQHHTGIGVLAGNSLAFTFSYEGISDREAEFGVVLYKFFAPNIMRGHWTGYGTGSLGYEECRKIDD